MRKVVYITTALLATAFTVLSVLYIIDTINDNHSFIGFEESLLWQIVMPNFFITAASLTFAILSLLQLKKSTPKLILLFCGNAFLASTNAIFMGSWWFHLIYFIAGLLPALYELIKYGSLVKQAPFQRQRYDGVMIASGVLSSICIAFCIYSLLSYMSLYNGFETEFTAYIYYSTAIGVIQCICTAVFCFFKRRRTGVLYRMFFIGSSVMSGILLPVNVAYIVAISSTASYVYVDPVRVLGSLVSLSLVILIIVHTVKTRRDGILPQQPAPLAQQQTELPAV